MNLYMKQKVFALKDKFDVYDAEESTLYRIEGKMISAHAKHYVYDPLGNQVAFIHQKILSLMPKFFIELADGATHEVKSKFKLAHEKAVIEDLGIEIEGSFLQHDYTITQNGQEIATVHQKWLSWGDTYELSINEGADEVLVLSLVLCFDILHQQEDAQSAAIASGTAAAGMAASSGQSNNQ